ncbi:MAG: universal stress protein [Winogradskyella sp.]|uniref:universal stress protein n=1 Tax=Winogradskyella sp. TaxID=1883156 RepID=UPI0017FEFFD4|nr:universal stress protein [Winogradskyella sp.]MBT8245861.1 universal stress protein [Winogradskyella sp.]NNK23068.1 universal stress protein [Winogradskyella sp.]
MKTILLPTDFSDNAWNAIVYALKLFKDEMCTFHILHTYTPIVYQVEYVPIGPAQYGLLDAIKETSETKMNTLMERIKEQFNNPKHSFETKNVFNTLISEIKDFTEKNKIDYVVMGTKGATGAKEILFGSNTVHVFKSLKCPVLAIPEHFDFEYPTEVLFPSDYEVHFKDRHLKPILNIVNAFKSRLNILHVSYGYELSDIQHENKSILMDYFKKVKPLFHDVANEKVSDAIDKFQMKTKINLLVMINNKHSFFENLFFKSTLKQIGFHLHVPLLVIPSQQ